MIYRWRNLFRNNWLWLECIVISLSGREEYAVCRGCGWEEGERLIPWRQG